ncbi:LytR/AlgR family response regulator transcription factor [Oceanobacillus sp. FSL H7-0719]|uniref:LytR/AlgR family response regulator transcription factor n=1 Tax=Oceanobacillus sp. FSL H7-0719 TaxID=2954507 RepID=UPI003244FDF3
MMMRAMIAEDEAMARKELMYLLQEEEDIVLSPYAENGKQLVELYKKHKPDIIFLDVEMPGMSGLEAAKIIAKQADKQPLFVFTTAYDEYALDAIDVEAIDYLLKPYEETHFKRALSRLRKAYSNKEKTNQQNMPLTKEKLLIDDGERMVVLAPEAIYYAVPHKKLLEIHTEDKIITSKMTLQELEGKLANDAFFRTHRSYLVNLNHIFEITPWFNGTSNVTLKDKEKTKIPVSRSASKILLKRFKL